MSEQGAGPIVGESGLELAEAHCPWYVVGGDPLACREDGKAVLAVAEYGRGQVTVFADGWLFSTESMGLSREKPTESQRRNHELAYLVLEETLRLRRRVREGS